jgi:glycosyltransferase involved in cell wall biosynthesis
MRQEVLISVIIPVYNAEKFVLNSYNEILNQNLPNFELIYVDNNSSDGTIAIIAYLINKDSRIKIYSQSIQGAGAARNTGIENALGKYLYFFDVDDTIYKNALIKLIQILDENESFDSVFGRRTRKIKGGDEFIGNEVELIKFKKPYIGLIWFDQFSSLVGPPAFLHRRSVIKKIGNFPENLLIGEDAAFHIKLGLFCNICFVDILIYNYHRHSESTVSINNKMLDKGTTYWNQYIAFYIPFVYQETYNVPREFKEILNKHLSISFAYSMVKINSFSKRNKKYKENSLELLNHKLPYVTEFFTKLLVLTGSEFVYKIFVKFYYTIYTSSINKRSESFKINFEE